MNPDDVSYDALFAALVAERALGDDLAAVLMDADVDHADAEDKIDDVLARYREARGR
jgi:GMP synthase PP-ATPase subunit